MKASQQKVNNCFIAFNKTRWLNNNAFHYTTKKLEGVVWSICDAAANTRCYFLRFMNSI